jgi:hypothetical protein
MKLYLENEKDKCFWQQLKKCKSIPWQKYLKKEETNEEIYSNEGIYQINPMTGKIYQLKQSCQSTIERKEGVIDGQTLFIDKNTWQYEETNRIPFEHTHMEVTTYTFSLFELKQKRVKCIIKMITKRESHKELYDFYFEAPPEIDDAIIKEEIDEFLCCLR